MTRPTKSDSIFHNKGKVAPFSEFNNVVRGKFTAPYFTKLASVVISFKDSFAPITVLGGASNKARFADLAAFPKVRLCSFLTNCYFFRVTSLTAKTPNAFWFRRVSVNSLLAANALSQCFSIVDGSAGVTIPPIFQCRLAAFVTLIWQRRKFKSSLNRSRMIGFALGKRRALVVAIFSLLVIRNVFSATMNAILFPVVFMVWVSRSAKTRLIMNRHAFARAIAFYRISRRFNEKCFFAIQAIFVNFRQVEPPVHRFRFH